MKILSFRGTECTETFKGPTLKTQFGNPKWNLEVSVLILLLKSYKKTTHQNPKTFMMFHFPQVISPGM